MTAADHVAVVGAGYMGGGIAQTFAAHGISCAIVDATAHRTRERVAQLHREAAGFVASGLLSEEAGQSIAHYLRPAESLDSALEGAAYVAEVVPEVRGLKSEVLAAITARVGSDVVIGTNTSAIPIGDLAESVSHAERFLGVHWMNPAPFVPCVEVIPGGAAGQAAVEFVLSLLERVGKAATVVGDSPGFVANRLQYALFREAMRLVEENVATPGQIDEVVRNSFGFRLPFFGPFAIADIAGLDVYRDGFATLEATYGERLGTPRLLSDLVDAGFRGLKTGQGFYRFDEAQATEVAGYRDRAYAELGRLREALGVVQLAEDQPQGLTQP